MRRRKTAAAQSTIADTELVGHGQSPSNYGPVPRADAVDNGSSASTYSSLELTPESHTPHQYREQYNAMGLTHAQPYTSMPNANKQF